MKRYMAYFWYLCRHKWYVLVELVGEGLWWRGITHDLSKFLPDEFIPYAHAFYNEDGSRRKKGSVSAEWMLAWLRHQRRNPHHWQYWVLHRTHGVEVFEMSDEYLIEMVCDWVGSGKAQGGSGAREFYEAHKYDMMLGLVTRRMVEARLR